MNNPFKLLVVVFSLLFVSPIYAHNGERLKKESINATLVERNGKVSIVSEEEYNTASDTEKRMINMIDATILALEKLDDNTKIGIISFSKDATDNFKNSIVIANKEEKDPEDEIIEYGSCKVCGMASAMRCLRELEKVKENSFDVHVEREGGCVKLRW